MNHIQWIQQREDFKTEYHVIKWKTSHFHEPFSERMVGSAKILHGAAPEAAKQSQQPEGEGIGYAQTDLSKSGGFGLGSGLEGYALRAMQEEVAQSAVRNTGSGTRAGKAVGAISAAVRTAAAAQTLAAEHMVTPEQRRESLRNEQARERNAQEATTVSAAGRGNIKNRLRESADRLREFYEKQKKKAAKLPLWKNMTEPKKKKVIKKTRMADREEILSMQAENHYLLDSYDQKGNYSTLGK
ncbi:MAG: hypothetical protein K2O59_06340 [Lachnospiraceae bacterium]|nr:hypothetical protein [Lachnospiraceae bacterium]